MNISLLYILFPCLFCISQNVVCLFIGSLTVHQEYLILNIRYGLNCRPQPSCPSYIWKHWEIFLVLVFTFFQHTNTWQPGDLTNIYFSFFVITALIWKPHKLTPKHFSCELRLCIEIFLNASLYPSLAEVSSETSAADLGSERHIVQVQLLLSLHWYKWFVWISWSYKRCSHYHLLLDSPLTTKFILVNSQRNSILAKSEPECPALRC